MTGGRREGVFFFFLFILHVCVCVCPYKEVRNRERFSIHGCFFARLFHNAFLNLSLCVHFSQCVYIYMSVPVCAFKVGGGGALTECI